MSHSHSGSFTMDIDATAEELFAIVTDIESYPEWIGDVKMVEVHDRTPEGYPASATMTIDVSIREVTYTIDYEYDHPSRVAWQSRPGSSNDLKDLSGSYTFEINDEGSTTVTYELELELGFKVPGFLLKKAAQRIAKTALGDLRDRASES